MAALSGRWEVAPFRRLLRGIDQGWSPTAEDRSTEPDEWAVLKLSAVSRGTFRPEEHKALPAELEPIRRLEVHRGDLLLTRANTPELVGDVCVVPEVRPNLMMSDLIYRLRLDTDRLEPRFAQYWLLSSPGRDQIARDARGSSQSMVKISQQTVRSWVIPVPALEEQRAISEYLDEKTSAIDALIAKRERHIEVLEEKRDAVLVDRVTRGLDPSVPLRGSGVNWLGVVPAHWKVAPTRFAARLATGHTPSRQHPEYWVPEECTVPWFTLADVWQIREGRQEYLGDTAEKVSPMGLANSSARLLPAETVILSRTASVGFSGIMPVPMATSQDFVNWVCGPEIRPLYLLYVFRAMRQEFRRLTMGSTHQTIYMPDVRDFRTPLPPLEEQDAIVAAVRAEMARHDGLVARIRKQIEKLREYRRTLISAAVTGQIPVREEVPA